ncbi:MAG: hypothetical protein IT176_03625 [Acidobacteria bacterium]|nr:hypothetical protein [Acidobacteriota bacterium]
MRVRVLYLIAAAATAAAIALPLWGFTMSAPQYPDESLHLQVGRTGISGDLHEVEALQKYIGVRFPTELPELRPATFGMAALAGLLLLAALTGPGRFGRAYRALCAVLFVLFLGASAVVVQTRLYTVGHDRDPNAPLRAIADFTPPLVGPVKVGNFTVWSFPHAGGVLLLAGSILSVAGLFVKPAGGTEAAAARRLSRKDAA